MGKKAAEAYARLFSLIGRFMYAIRVETCKSLFTVDFDVTLYYFFRGLASVQNVILVWHIIKSIRLLQVVQEVLD